MSKKTALSNEQIAEKLRALADQVSPASKAAPEAEKTTLEVPDAKTLAKMKDDEVVELADKLQIPTEDVKPKVLRSLIGLAIKVAEDDDLTDEEIKKLATGLELEVKKKSADTLALIKDYLKAEEAVDEAVEEDAEEADEAEEADDDSDEDSDDEEDKAEETDDDDAEEDSEDDADEESDDDEDENSDDDSDDDESEEDDDDDEDSDADDNEDSDSDDEGDEEVEVTAENIVEYNKHAKKKFKKDDTDALKELLTDDEGNVHAWGEPYIKDEEGYCCGLKMADVEGEDNQGKCVVTGKVYGLNDDDEFVEVTPKKAKKKK